MQIIRFEPTPGSGPPSRVYALGPNPQKEVRREERAPRDWPEASPALLEAMDALARHGSD